MAVSFEKRVGVSLDKKAAREGVGVRLDKKATGLITAELRWQSGVGTGRADLDLFGWVVGAGTRGRKGGLKGMLGKSDALAEVVYHKHLGSLHQPPYLEHGGDSREPGVETIRVGSLDQVQYVLFGVYQAFGNGAGSLRSFDAHVVVTDTEGNRTRVNLTESHPNRYWVTVALVDLTPPQGYVVRPVEEYSRPGTEKSPVLYADGHFTMNAGPRYLFK
ncbi:hypothetical protein E1281_22615 [Actinomadura sp. KC345]|uniref:TerD family protein n=1 Tax=Actinomadura sp. KC345 TaxID=2530371 RepID=UPI001050CE77|nr:TerD family protein [Actinomadura sp. KC345]TDC49947.1 hypothetical protein E1281_22615 [Actinomadura sp. KC345]